MALSLRSTPSCPLKSKGTPSCITCMYLLWLCTLHALKSWRLITAFWLMGGGGILTSTSCHHHFLPSPPVLRHFPSKFGRSFHPLPLSSPQRMEAPQGWQESFFFFLIHSCIPSSTLAWHVAGTQPIFVQWMNVLSVSPETGVF